MNFIKSSASVVALGASNLVQGMADFAARSSEALPAADPTPSTVTLDPDELAEGALKLTDLTIPNSLKEWLGPSLGRLKFEIETVQTSVIGNPKRSFDVIRNAAGHRTLLHIPSKILENRFTWVPVAGIITFGMALKNQPLVILSEGLQSANPTYRLMTPNLQQVGLTWEFRSWKELSDIKPMSQDEQALLLPQMFQLEDLLDQARNLPETPISLREITVAEINELTEIIGSLDYFRDHKTAWRTVLEEAELEKVALSVSLDGLSTEVARRILSDLNTRKPLPAHPEDQVLGLFLCRILKIGELNAAGIQCIETILKKYALVTSRK